MMRNALLERLIQVIQSIVVPHPVRVAVDGPDAAGKTTLADELAARLGERGRTVIRKKLYYAVARPAESADLVVENDDPEQPRLRPG